MSFDARGCPGEYFLWSRKTPYALKEVWPDWKPKRDDFLTYFMSRADMWRSHYQIIGERDYGEEAVEKKRVWLEKIIGKRDWLDGLEKTEQPDYKRLSNDANENPEFYNWSDGGTSSIEDVGVGAKVRHSHYGAGLLVARHGSDCMEILFETVGAKLISTSLIQLEVLGVPESKAKIWQLRIPLPKPTPKVCRRSEDGEWYFDLPFILKCCPKRFEWKGGIPRLKRYPADKKEDGSAFVNGDGTLIVGGEQPAKAWKPTTPKERLAVCRNDADLRRTSKAHRARMAKPVRGIRYAGPVYVFHAPIPEKQVWPSLGEYIRRLQYDPRIPAAVYARVWEVSNVTEVTQKRQTLTTIPALVSDHGAPSRPTTTLWHLVPRDSGLNSQSDSSYTVTL
jgi:hypothetical protein